MPVKAVQALGLLLNDVGDFKFTLPATTSRSGAFSSIDSVHDATDLFRQWEGRILKKDMVGIHEPIRC